ncbi:hypothetical protein [Niastella sp. OAS944]|uniref:hypothetical protein n=1 Tax=Niastella sp. OAS944 TaxID=2664089 RepID=UPI003496EB39|nr:hypothetical protein [Chitinophagaceae bacterium OAS944]
MLTFKIKPNGFKEIRKKILLFSIPGFVIGAVFTGTSLYTSTMNRRNDVTPGYVPDHSMQLIDLATYLPIVIFIAILGFGLNRMLKKTKKTLDSYELTISDNLIAREQLNTPTISIYISEVQEIIKRKKGGFYIKGEKARDLIIVPKQIENPEQLEIALEKIKPLVSKGKAADQLKWQALLGLASMALLITVNVSLNKTVVAIGGTLFLGLTVYNFVQAQKSKNIDYKTKRTRWISLVLSFFVIYVMYIKLTGNFF